MKHIVQFSGGKDSTAMLLMMLERGMQVDEIIMCDTGMEFPGMYQHIEEVRQYIKPYGKDITILKAEHSYEYYMFDKVLTRGMWKGQPAGYGWARTFNRWCTRILKVDPTNKYLKSIGVDNYISYIGIAYDEPKRHYNKSVPETTKHPLFEWEITEKKALSYCKEHGFTWGGLYEDFKRVSCWCCPLQGLNALRTLYHKYPELWQKLKWLDRRAGKRLPFRPDYTVAELEAKFQREDNGKRLAISLWDE